MCFCEEDFKNIFTFIIFRVIASNLRNVQDELYFKYKVKI